MVTQLPKTVERQREHYGSPARTEGVFKPIDARGGACYHDFEFVHCLRKTDGQIMSDFGLCATDVREPRQVRKEATVTNLSVCRRSPEV